MQKCKLLPSNNCNEIFAIFMAGSQKNCSLFQKKNLDDMHKIEDNDKCCSLSRQIS